jgi:hypothetical protein
LARIAERLGRGFEARAFRAIAISNELARNHRMPMKLF